MSSRLIIAIVFCLFLTGPVAAATPAKPDAGDRCPVCGMFVAPYPQWLAVAEFADGSHQFFDGPKDLFIFYFDLQRYQPGASPADIKQLYVTEYYSARLLPVSEILFVTGSDVLGPMGQELVPVVGREAAETFRRDHAGQKVMRFDGSELIDVTESP